MKINWGTGIFIFLIIFVSLAIAFMIFAFNQEINLVHKDYYEKGLNFDQEINIKHNSAKYVNFVNVKTQNKLIKIIFDDSIKNNCSDITVYFYNHAEHNNDYKIKFNNLINDITIEKSKLKKGRYTINISWKINNKHYKVKKDFNIK